MSAGDFYFIVTHPCADNPSRISITLRHQLMPKVHATRSLNFVLPISIKKELRYSETRLKHGNDNKTG